MPPTTARTFAPAGTGWEHQHGDGDGHPLTGAGDRTLAREDTASWAAVAGLMAAVLGPLTWLVMEAVRLALA